MATKNIKLFDNNKSCGLDGIHPRQLRELVDHVSGPIGKILHQSIKDEMKWNEMKMKWKFISWLIGFTKIYELWLFYNSWLLQLHTDNQMGDHSISLRLVKENGHPSIFFFFFSFYM